MDENSNKNNNKDNVNMQPTKTNPFKNRAFYIAYFLTIGISCAIAWILMGSDSYWFIGVMLLCIPYAIVGVIAWAIIKKRNRAVALGILLASLTPFIFVFLGTGGCGLSTILS